MELSIDLLKTFVAIIDSGGFTSAADVVHRTQSAISMQVKRLEETIGQPLFERTGRSFNLTAQGEALVPYARRMLKLHEETVTAMVRPEMVGEVRLGTPDDYALRYLPAILAQFATAYPKVQVTVRCEPSTMLAPALDRGELDLTLLTGDLYRDRSELVRRDPTHWITSGRHTVHEEDPLPLAVFQCDCVFRDWAFESLNGIGRSYRIAYQSASTAGILAAVSAGLAVTVLAASVVPDDLKVLGEADGFPELPETPIIMRRSAEARSSVVDAMANFICEGFRG